MDVIVQLVSHIINKCNMLYAELMLIYIDTNIYTKLYKSFFLVEAKVLHNNSTGHISKALISSSNTQVINTLTM